MTQKDVSSENRFRVDFTTYTGLNRTVVSANIPEITHTQVNIPYNGDNVKVPADNEEIGELNVTFKLDEDYENYTLIYEWMQWNKLNGNSVDGARFDTIEYFILDAEYRPIKSFKYGYVFPTVLSQIDHTSMTPDADEIEFIVTFAVNTIIFNSSI